MILKGYFSGRCPITKVSISAGLKKPRLMGVSLLEGRKLSLEMYRASTSNGVRISNVFPVTKVS
jgi:hypothetical protein